MPILPLSWPQDQLSYLSQVRGKRGESPCLPLPLYHMDDENLAKCPVQVCVAGSPMPHQWIQSTVLPGKGIRTSYPSAAAEEEQNQSFHFHVPQVCFFCLQQVAWGKGWATRVTSLRHSCRLVTYNVASFPTLMSSGPGHLHTHKQIQLYSAVMPHLDLYQPASYSFWKRIFWKIKKMVLFYNLW